MNAMIVENIISWFLFALASTCTLSFASTVYDNFVNTKRRQRYKEANTKGVVPHSHLEPSPLSMEGPAIRGYDSPELFREDLWIRRIEHSRREHAALVASIPQVKVRLESPQDLPRRLCEVLTYRARTRQR